MGAQFLKIQRNEAPPPKPVAPLGTSKRLPRIARKKVTVAEVEKSGKMIAMDLEWDTTSWSKEEIESGCETLVAVFQAQNASEAYEDQALKMLEKLMIRHKAAIGFMRKNIEVLLSKAITRRLVGGQSGGLRSSSLSSLNLRD